MNTIKMSPSSINSGIYETFENGLDFKKWNISCGKWGGDNVNNGVSYENVFISKRNTLLLRASGNYSKYVKRRGAVICSKQLCGPGEYEVVMKIAPRLGVCNAFWTFYYNHITKANHEIDIELPGNLNGKEIGYNKSLSTTWLDAEKKYKTTVEQIVPLNDNQFHTYKFIWHTTPKLVEFYIDNKLKSTTTEFIPLYKGVLNVGVWFPNKWCGEAEFEDDFMEVKSIRYTPFDEPCFEQDYQKDEMAKEENFPFDKVDVIASDLVINNEFKGNYGWDKQIPSNILKSNSISQIIPCINDTITYNLKVNADINGDENTVTLYYYNVQNEFIDTVQFSLNKDVTSYPIHPLKNASSMKIEFTSKNDSFVSFKKVCLLFR